MAEQLLPVVHEVAGKAMRLGFTKVAIYEPGAELPFHHDQILNEVSITLSLQASKQALNGTWPLVLIPPPSLEEQTALVRTSLSTKAVGDVLILEMPEIAKPRV